MSSEREEDKAEAERLSKEPSGPAEGGRAEQTASRQSYSPQRITFLCGIAGAIIFCALNVTTGIVPGGAVGGGIGGMLGYAVGAGINALRRD